MAKQTFTAGQVLTAAEMNSLQENDYNWTVTTKTASYTLAAGDEGTRIVMDNVGATTITVDDAVFAAGDVVWIHNIGAGTCTITAGTATVNTDGSLALEQYQGGQLFFTSASSAIFFPNVGAQAGGKILQVVSTTKTDTFAVATIGDQAITGLSATITPTSATSTIYVVASVVHSSSLSFFSFLLLTRGGTAIALGDTAGSRTTVTGGYSMNTVSDTARVTNSILTTLDSPATTSSTTYGVSFRNTSGTVTQYLNRSTGDANDPARFRSSSTITVMEVSA